jgi:hypothetical protein
MYCTFFNTDYLISNLTYVLPVILTLIVALDCLLFPSLILPNGDTVPLAKKLTVCPPPKLASIILISDPNAKELLVTGVDVPGWIV